MMEPSVTLYPNRLRALVLGLGCATAAVFGIWTGMQRWVIAAMVSVVLFGFALTFRVRALLRPQELHLLLIAAVDLCAGIYFVVRARKER
jgi:hypothetical protein